MNQAIRKLSGLLVLPVLLAALLLMPVRVQAAGYECYADLPVSVVINGDYEEQFTVVLTPGDETTPMPTQSALQIAGGATGVFEDLHFTEPGDYYYTVQQTPGTSSRPLTMITGTWEAISANSPACRLSSCFSPITKTASTCFCSSSSR